MLCQFDSDIGLQKVRHMSVNKILKELKTRMRKKYKTKIRFRKFPHQNIISDRNWCLEDLLKVTPKPMVYFPDYHWSRDYEYDTENIKRLVDISGNNKFMFYTCQENNDAKHDKKNVLVIIPEKNYVKLYISLDRLDNLKAFL